MDKDDVVRFIEDLEEARDASQTEVSELEDRVGELEAIIAEYQDILGDRRALLFRIGELS